MYSFEAHFCAFQRQDTQTRAEGISPFAPRGPLLARVWGFVGIRNKRKDIQTLSSIHPSVRKTAPWQCGLGVALAFVRTARLLPARCAGAGR